MKTRMFICAMLCMTASLSAQVTDIDGNTYKTVRIGEQEWMAENLRTTSYRDGSPIAYPGEDNQAWLNNKTGAFAWYRNDLKWKELYGALYNQYAVNNEAGLCPDGWRVSVPEDWGKLINTVREGRPSYVVFPVGNKLKSCRQQNSPLGDGCENNEHPRWHSSDHYGTDEFGFGALPGGMRSDVDGNFSNLGAHAYFWASHTESRIFVILNFLPGMEVKLDVEAETGASVRCIKINP